MKLAVFLNRRRVGRAAPSISLFPFLAVLVCVMGSLVPLLLVMAHQVRRSAATEAASRAAQRQEELRIQREDLQWQAEQLEAARKKTEAQLQQARQMLGHVEDHTRRLEQQADALEAQWKELQQSTAVDDRQLGALSAEWQAVQRQLAAAARQIESTRQGASRKPSYAIMPYEGPNQTRRRPIYLECTPTAVILQPEGVELLDADFKGPLGASNPLVALLRATREYWIANGGFDPNEGDAYPLLLVRPDGIEAYGAALAALRPWGNDFGYELIADDWKLAFPPADPRLAQVARTALDHARLDQARIMAAAPRHYPSARLTSGGQGYGGGGQEQGGAGHGLGAAGGAGATGGLGPGRPYSAVPGRPVASRFDGGEDGSRTAGATPGRGTAGASATGGALGPDLGPADGSNLTQPSAMAGSPGGSCPRGPAAGRNTTTGAGAGQRPEDVVIGRSGETSAAPGEGLANRPGEWHEPPPKANRREPDEKTDHRKPSVARHRGREWGLPDAAARATRISRPIRVDCYADRLIVAPSSVNRMVPLPRRAEDATDELIAAIWAEIDAWGIAGQNVYWRPVLHVRVDAGAEDRFDQLVRMLEGSGIGVEGTGN